MGHCTLHLNAHSSEHPHAFVKVCGTATWKRGLKIQECSTHCLWLLHLISEEDWLSWKLGVQEVPAGSFPGWEAHAEQTAQQTG